MQWDKTLNAGFSEVTPWINVNPNYKSINVEDSIKDPNSIYNYYKKMIEVHKKEALLVEAEYKDLLPKNKHLFIYTRTKDNITYLCINNFEDKDIKYKLPKIEGKKEILLSNYNIKDINEEKLILKPYETRLYKITK